MREHLKNLLCQSQCHNVTHNVTFSLPTPPLQPLDYVWQPFATPSILLTNFDIVCTPCQCQIVKNVKNRNNNNHLRILKMGWLSKFISLRSIPFQLGGACAAPKLRWASPQDLWLKFLGPNIFLDPKFFTPKFWTQHFLDPKFQDPKYFLTNNILGP